MLGVERAVAMVEEEVVFEPSIANGIGLVEGSFVQVRDL